MNNKIKDYLDDVFAPYEHQKTINELKIDLLTDLQERYAELIKEGKSEDVAYEMAIDSIGDIEETVDEMASLSRKVERQITINFHATSMPNSVLTGISMKNGEFKASTFTKSNFSGSDLSGGVFKASDLKGTIFDGANLTDCTFVSSEMSDTSFVGSTLVNTSFITSELKRAKFGNVKFTDCTFKCIPLEKCVIENCAFEGVVFKYCDLSDTCFDNMSFNAVKFEKTSLKNASFKGATLKNVAFYSFLMSGKFLRELKTVKFDGAKMDKITYAALKSYGIDLDSSNITII